MTDERRPWRRRIQLVGLALGFASLFLVRSIVDRGAQRVRATRAELGVIELVHGQGPGGVKGWVATFDVDQPVARVWKVLSDCESFPKVLRGVTSCRLLHREGNVKHHHMVLTHPEDSYMETRTEYDEARHRTRWRMEKGSFRAAEGGITLEKHPKHRGWTRVTYAYYLNISAVLPESFEVPRVRRSVRRMAQEIQTYFTGPPRPARAAGGRDVSSRRAPATPP